MNYVPIFGENRGPEMFRESKMIRKVKGNKNYVPIFGENRGPEVFRESKMIRKVKGNNI